VLNEKDDGIARIDENISIEYPKDGQLPRSPAIQGRGGMHFKRTLAQFSLENTVSVVTGGASGIGLAMSQAIVASGSHLAIVDMNRKIFAHHVLIMNKWMLITEIQEMKPTDRLRRYWNNLKQKTLGLSSNSTPSIS
jgi:hypothetical protein